MTVAHVSGPMMAMVAAAALVLPFQSLADDDDGNGASVTFADVETFPILGGDVVDGASILIRNDEGVAYTFNTRGLQRAATYTNWWVAFNNPEACFVPCACSGADFSNADVEIGVFWATGRVANGFGQADFTAEVDYGELPDGIDQVRPARPNPISPSAEIHLIVRAHGPTVGDGEAQLTQFNGGCPPNPVGVLGGCIDVQFAIHRAPQCQAGDDDDG